MQISNDFREKILTELINQESNFGGTKTAYARQFGLRGDIYSSLKKRDKPNLITAGKWVEIARILGVETKSSNWKIVETEIYKNIEDGIKWCQDYQESTILVDKCGIGKTESAFSVVKKLRNAFYIDCSQAKSKIQFFRAFAKTIGVENTGKYTDVKENIKYGLNLLETPVVVLDEFGDLDYSTFLDIKEIQNATPNRCGWFAMGANGLRQKIEKGINNEKVGFAEVFDRFSGKITSITPTGADEFKAFMHKLLTDVGTPNNISDIPTNTLVMQCLKDSGSIRKLKALIKISA